MPLKYQKFITREDVRRNPDKLYVFGDNVRRTGRRGQAAQMKGEPNTIGVATKWTPSLQLAAFFYDSHYLDARAIIDQDLEPVKIALKEGRTVIWPEDNIGTGLSDLPNKAPMVWSHLLEQIHLMEKL